MGTLDTDSGRRTPARLAGRALLACQSDERLVEMVRAGHERAFDAIVDRYRRPLVRFCGRMLPESRCEDAVQQAFINAHAALLGSDEPLQLKPWLFTVARNAALNMVRQNGWNYEEIPLDFDGVRRPDQIFEERTRLRETVAAMGELPVRQRDALVMREFEGRSYEEIGEALDANDGAVRQLLNRARVTLRTAATALVPSPLLARLAMANPSDGRRLAEVVSAVGAAGAAKAGATALVAGTLVVGAVQAPLPVGDGNAAKEERATVAKQQRERPARDALAAAAPVLAPEEASKTDPARNRGAARRQVARERAPKVERDRPERPTPRQLRGEGRGPGPGFAPDREREDRSGPERHERPEDDEFREERSGPSGGDDRLARERTREFDDSASSGPGSGEEVVEPDSSGPGSGDDDPLTEITEGARAEDHSGPGSGELIEP